jgi:exosome complex component CSL4
LQVGDHVCGDEWAGVVRREDVRATEKDRVVVGEGFRVGDLVRGVVVGFLLFFGFGLLFFFWWFRV